MIVVILLAFKTKQNVWD